MNLFSSPNEYEPCPICDGLGIVQDEGGYLHQCDWCSGTGQALNPFYVDEELERSSEAFFDDRCEEIRYQISGDGICSYCGRQTDFKELPDGSLIVGDCLFCDSFNQELPSWRFS